MLLPMLCGLLTAWIVMGAICVAALLKCRPATPLTAAIGTSGVLLLALLPVSRRAAWIYSNARKYHTAEYFYDLGNGVEPQKAVRTYEKKVRRSVCAWLKRKLWKSSFGVVPVSFFLLLALGTDWLDSLVTAAGIGIAVSVATLLCISVMLRVARRTAYDKLGNVKNG